MLLWQNLYRQPGLVHLEPASGPVGRGGESTLGSGWEEQKAALTWGEEQLHGSPELSKCCCLTLPGGKDSPGWRSSAMIRNQVGAECCREQAQSFCSRWFVVFEIVIYFFFLIAQHN